MLTQAGRLRGFFRNLDLCLMGLTLVTALFGILMISSAAGDNSLRCVIVQSVALVLGIGGICALMILDYEYLAQISTYIYGICCILLVLVLIPGLGKVENGARSWFRLGPLSFQPAELAKIGFVITFARHLSEKEYQINRPRVLLGLLAHVGILVGLILLQPDFGTAMVFVCMALAMLLITNLSWKYIVGGLSAIVVLCPLAWFFFLQDYQKARIINVFHPENDPSGTGYHVLQSKLAVGSGRIFGTGLYKGSSQVNNLLPERHTDFIYSVICEELGIIGGILVILLLTLIILRCIYVGLNARNSLGTYICTGVAAMLIFQVFENIGMCIGLFPITGITLPFFSYGGSSLVTTMLAVGLVVNVRFRCRMINFS